MELNLNRPLLFFDIESTGLSIPIDSIIELSFVKVFPGGESRIKTWKIKPWDYVNKCQKPINPEASKVNGVTDDMLTGCPRFFEVVDEVVDWLKDSDLAGFNSNRFDVPMLAEEFLRAGQNYDFSRCRLIDAQTIFHKMERRNLAAAYKFYCGRKMEDDFQAHLADQDTEATYRVLQGELDMYAPGKQEEEERQLENDMDVLNEFSRQNDNVDFAGRLVWGDVKGPDGKPLLDKNGKPRKQEYFNFGKYKGFTVADVLRRDPGYFSWMMAGDFPLETKQWMTRIRMRESGLMGK